MVWPIGREDFDGKVKRGQQTRCVCFGAIKKKSFARIGAAWQHCQGRLESLEEEKRLKSNNGWVFAAKATGTGTLQRRQKITQVKKKQERMRKRYPLKKGKNVKERGCCSHKCAITKKKAKKPWATL